MAVRKGRDAEVGDIVPVFFGDGDLYKIDFGRFSDEPIKQRGHGFTRKAERCCKPHHCEPLVVGKVSNNLFIILYRLDIV